MITLPDAPEPPRFDPAARLWVLSRHTDVAAALRDPRFGPAGVGGVGERGAVDAGEHASFRREARRDAGLWDATAAGPLAERLFGALPPDRPVDLVFELAEPFGRALAVTATGAGAARGEDLHRLAGDIFGAAAEPFDEARQIAAGRATRELAGALPGAFAVQAFVALSQSLPCFLASAWLALLQHPGELALLRERPGLLPDAIEELLRYAGPSRALFRQALSPLRLGDADIAAGERVVLSIASANRDPEVFPDPHRLDLRRKASPHLAFGAGGHACIGAPLIRALSAEATRVFAAYFVRAQLCEPVPWRRGFAIHAPGPVWVWRFPANGAEGSESRGGAPL